MGLLDRIFRGVRASLTAAVSGAEDPERVLEQTVADMQSDLIQLRQSVAQAIATQKRTERQCDQAQATAQEWYSRAQLALNKGDEATARSALARRQTYLGTAQVMTQQLQQQQGVVEQLKVNMRKLEAKLAETRTQKDLYIARARSAQASRRLHEMLGKVGNDTLRQMEDRILDLEAQSEAIAQVNALSESGQLEQRFADLASEAEIDAEMALLKAEGGGQKAEDNSRP